MTLKAQWTRPAREKSPQGFLWLPGPNDCLTRATKVSVGIVAHDGADADPVERWFCETSDARTDPEIIEAVVRFIEQHGARSVATVDRIIGCPHEEGIDYPEGEACPLCPFWRNRDRWGGGIIG